MRRQGGDGGPGGGQRSGRVLAGLDGMRRQRAAPRTTSDASPMPTASSTTSVPTVPASGTKANQKVRTLVL
jgi:hypothetical protein